MNNFYVIRDMLFVTSVQALLVKRSPLSQFYLMEGQLIELTKLAFVALVTTFPWERKLFLVLFCSLYL